MFFPQFVPFRDYIDRTGNHILSMARLAKDVLAEIPDQFLSYMRTRGIKPSPAPPPYTPPGQPLQTQIWGVKMWKTCIWVEVHVQNTFISRSSSTCLAVLDHGGDSHIQEGVCRPGACHISAQEKPMKVCLLPLSSIPLGVWILFFVLYLVEWKTWKTSGELKSSWGIKEVLMLEKTERWRKLLHWRRNVSRQNKGSLTLSWSFCK